MAYYIQGSVDPEFFEKEVDRVVKKMEPLEGLKFDIVAVEDKDKCGEVFQEIPLKDEEAFMKNCRDTDTSISFRAEGEEVIIVKMDKEFLREDAAALRGLVAHELMHTIQRRSGVEEDIQKAASSYSEDAIENLQEMGMNRAEVGRFIRTVFGTAVFCLKDIYANTELIRRSFVKELEHYYYEMLEVENYCPVPEFYGEEASLDEIEDAVSFELGLLPAWLPFEALNRPEAKEIRDRINECYERDIPQVAYYIHRIRDLYLEKYDKPEEFKNLFFSQIFESTYTLIEKKVERIEPGNRS